MPTYFSAPHIDSQLNISAIHSLIKAKVPGWISLKQITPFLLSEYDSYPFNFSKKSFFIKNKRSPQTAEILFGLYEKTRKSFRYIVKHRRIGRKVGCCPYCGMPGNMTLDHYLPRDKRRFPQYAALPANLVPACFDCQIKKGNFSPDIGVADRLTVNRKKKMRKLQGNGEQKKYSSLFFYASRKRIIHPYYDGFLKKPVIFFRYNNDVKNGNSFIIKNCSQSEKSLLNFHLKKLDISTRIESAVSRFRNVIVKNFMHEKITTDAAAIDRLPQMLRDAVVRGGGVPNYIEAATIRSIMADRQELNRVLLDANGKNYALNIASVARKVKHESTKNRGRNKM